MHTLLYAQKMWLISEIATLESAAAALPVPESRDWSGGAQVLYSAGLAQVHQQAQAALELLRTALASTLRALDSLAGRG